MINLNNVLGNNNVEGGNNMRGPVVIKSTVTEKRAKETRMTKELHDALAKRFMKQHLYSWAPVFKMVTISGLDDNDNLISSVYNTTGGNSPVIREVVSRVGTEVKEVEIVQVLPDGRKSARKVMCGVDPVKGKMKYDYLEEVVLVQFKDLKNNTKEQKEANELLVSTILDKGLTIVMNNGELTVRIGKDVEVDDIVVQHVTPFIWTPSNERNGQILMTSLDHNEAWDILETIGGGSVTKLLRQGEMPMKKFKKLASRIGLFATPAIKFGKVGTKKYGLLLIDKNIVGADDFDKAAKEVLKSIGVDIDDNQFDGATWFSAQFMAECFSKKGLKISPKQALMFSAQMRVNKVYAKVFGEALSHRVINKLADVLIEMMPKDKVKVIGNRDNIAMILDNNGAKLLDLTLDEPCDVYLLDIAKGTKSGTAVQMTDKMAIKDQQATCDFLFNQAIKDCHDFTNSIGDVTKSLFEDVDVANYLINLAKVYQGELAQKVFTDQFIVSGILKDVAKKHEAAYRKGRVEIDSIFQRALFDNTYVLVNGKLDSLLKVDDRGAIECYSTDVLEEHREAIDAIENDNTINDYQKDMKLRELLTACIIKYPTPGTEEIELVVFLTEKQIDRRLKELVKSELISFDEALTLYDYFIYTSFGTIKIAADNAVKHKLAGMDTDYDGVVVVFEKALVSIIEKVYVERTEELQESTGTNATHGGTVPYIDCDHGALNFLDLEAKKVNTKPQNVKDEMEVWKEYLL